MLSDSITLNSRVFDRRWDKENESLFGVAGLTSPEIRTLGVKHSVSGQGDAAIERKLVRSDNTIANSEGELVTASAYIVVVRPTDAAVTDAVIQNLIDDVTDFYVETTNGPIRLAKILNGES